MKYIKKHINEADNSKQRVTKNDLLKEFNYLLENDSIFKEDVISVLQTVIFRILNVGMSENKNSIYISDPKCTAVDLMNNNIVVRIDADCTYRNGSQYTFRLGADKDYKLYISRDNVFETLTTSIYNNTAKIQTVDDIENYTYQNIEAAKIILLDTHNSIFVLQPIYHMHFKKDENLLTFKYEVVESDESLDSHWRDFVYGISNELIKPLGLDKLDRPVESIKKDLLNFFNHVRFDRREAPILSVLSCHVALNEVHINFSKSYSTGKLVTNKRKIKQQIFLPNTKFGKLNSKTFEIEYNGENPTIKEI